MRLCSLVLVVPALGMAFGMRAAAAQDPFYYAERGHWWVSSSGTAVCRATNRPPEEVNASPYNVLQIAQRPGQEIGVTVMFWPDALEPGRGYTLRLGFEGGEAIDLDAQAIDTFWLESEPRVSRELWQGLQAAAGLDVAVADAPKLRLHFVLDDSDWLLESLQHCVGLLARHQP